MKSWSERIGQRLQAALVLLAERSEPTPRSEVIDFLAAHFPPEGNEADIVAGGKEQRWRDQFLWQTTNLVKAGWIVKDGRGTWTITDKGRQAIHDYPEAISIHREANRLFNEWNQERKSVQHRAWLIRGSSVLGVNVVPQWLAEGFCSLAASQLREMDSSFSAEKIEIAAREDYDHLKHQELTAKVDEILAFTTRVRIGDVIMATSEAHVYLGDITGNWSWVRSDGGRSNLRRLVDWRNADTPIDFADLPAPLPAKLSSGSTVVDLTADLEIIESLTTAPVAPIDQPTAEPQEPLAIERPDFEHLPEPSAALASSIFADPDWLAEVRAVLDERRQLIFYGPPGTGKTFIARKLATDLVGLEQVKLVQFHPAYTYEDFFEGYRPKPSGPDGSIGFELRQGPFRQLVTRARQHPDQAFVLIIDEINRANLAKVFGELYFLLEYRDAAVDLMYSSGEEPFSLPANLFVIGTMNTADRSIALVDSAMRRRFAFFALDPDTEPTRSLLARWSAHHGLSDLASGLLAELNRRIEDPDFRIGPSYFMVRHAPDAFDPVRLARIWHTSILPLLEEHFYGQWETQRRRFDLDTLLRAADQTNARPGAETPQIDDYLESPEPSRQQTDGPDDPTAPGG
jgi:5-methylcytosine-specific restriction protein B